MTAGRGGLAEEPACAPVPPPNTLRYNEWQQLPVAPAESFSPTEAVTVVVPYFEAPMALEALLAGLERQAYPRELLEVIVVDDGSSVPLGRPSSPLAVRVIRQERRGFGLARARNNGARAAAHDILVFLDGDMIPDTDLLAAHARWHHAVADALTLGFRASAPERVDVAALRHHSGSLRELYGQHDCDAWREPHLVRSADLRSRHDWLFRTMVGANFAMRKAFYLSLGGCDESFARYGGEDTELAYRACTRGAVLVPVRGALAWHQQAPGEDQARKRRQAQAQRAKLANLIPLSPYRDAAGAAVHAVPRYVVTLRPDGEPAETVAETVAGAVENILSDASGDVVVRIEAGRLPETALVWLDEFFAAEARVRIAPLRAALDEFAAAPLHVVLPAGSAAAPGIVSHLGQHLGTAVRAAAPSPGGGNATVTRAWALHRAERTGCPVTAFGAAVRAPPQGRRPPRPSANLPTQSGGAARALSALAREVRYVRGPRTALALLRWLAGGVRRRLRRLGARAAAVPEQACAERRYRALGVEIAFAGERAAAVFAASSQVRRHRAERSVEVVLADTRATAATGAPSTGAPSTGAPSTGAPAVILADRPQLSVPAFDPAIHNPIGWRRTVENRVATLGPPHLLPRASPRAREVSARDRRALLASHHLADSAAFHGDPASRAGVLVRVAASGLPVRLADRDAGLEACLGAEFLALMSVQLDPADADARESLSVRTRRLALRDHSLRSRARQVCEAALADPPVPPKVSILLATKRPELVRWAMSNVARQSYPNLELVVVLHGDGFGNLDDGSGPLRCPVKVLRLDRHRVLGSVLNAAVEASSGLLLTKMDDDDLYGADHVWDLVLAHEYSGAHLVGKGIENVYLSKADRTVKRQSGQAETHTSDLAGGTLLVARHDLAKFGGWPRVPRAVDNLLIQAILDGGGRIYRTHGAGFVLVRHGAGHTWGAGDTFFLGSGSRAHAGWRPAVADIAADAECSRPPLPAAGR